jgi:hypothetical protein
VDWVSRADRGFISEKNLGLLSGLLMVKRAARAHYGWREI